jgi:hypothetical protein
MRHVLCVAVGVAMFAAVGVLMVASVILLLRYVDRKMAALSIAAVNNLGTKIVRGRGNVKED